MADITDYFGKASLDTDYAVATTVKTARSPGASVLEAYDLSKFSDDTPVFVITYKKTTDPETGEVSVIDQRSFKALVNTGANTLTNLTIAPGYVDDLGNDEDDFIECIPTSYWANDLINGILEEHNPNGTHKNVNADTLTTPTLNDVALADVGFLGNEEYYTSNDTWTKPDNLKFIIVEVQAGGGGGAGCPTATNSGASGGGGGGYALKKILAADLAATVAVTVGAGGAGGAAGTNNGVDGSSSSFGSHASATGGSRGLTSGSSVGGAGGVGTGGDINIDGGYGFGGETAAPPTAGAGGASKLGIGGGGGKGSFSGKNGTGYGSGGSAGCRVNSGGQPGGAGAGGIVIVREFF